MNQTKSKIVIIKIKKVFIVNEKNGIRYKVIAEDGNEYRFFWDNNPEIIEFQAIMQKQITLQNVNVIIWREGGVWKEKNITYKGYYEIKFNKKRKENYG